MCVLREAPERVSVFQSVEPPKAKWQAAEVAERLLKLGGSRVLARGPKAGGIFRGVAELAKPPPNFLKGQNKAKSGMGQNKAAKPHVSVFGSIYQGPMLGVRRRSKGLGSLVEGEKLWLSQHSVGF